MTPIELAAKNLLEAIRPYAEGDKEDELRGDIVAAWDELDKAFKELCPSPLK
jgi:hypothetical protein